MQQFFTAKGRSETQLFQSNLRQQQRMIKQRKKKLAEMIKAIISGANVSSCHANANDCNQSGNDVMLVSIENWKFISGPIRFTKRKPNPKDFNKWDKTKLQLALIDGVILYEATTQKFDLKNKIHNVTN